MTLEEFYHMVRSIAYTTDCELCGVPDELLDLADQVEHPVNPHYK